MTKINLHGILSKEFGSGFSMKIDNLNYLFDAIETNKDGFKKRIFDLNSQGFEYSVTADKKKIKSAEEFLSGNIPKEIDIVPILSGSGGTTFIIIAIIVSTAASILLAPEPPEPPEVSQSTQALEKSFTFSSVVNRAAQGTPVPVGYGELMIGSEVVQSTLKSYPQNQRAFEAFKRNPFDSEAIITQSASQLRD